MTADQLLRERDGHLLHAGQGQADNPPFLGGIAAPAGSAAWQNLASKKVSPSGRAAAPWRPSRELVSRGVPLAKHLARGRGLQNSPRATG
eukprot:7620381-Pyramimonas_sp.AAC.1